MSSKNVKGPSQPYDLYHTPKVEVVLAMKRLAFENPGFKPTSFLEPGAGACPFCDVASETFPTIAHITGVELNPSTASKTHEVELTDFLTWETQRRYDLVCTNPPFSLAEPFLQRSLELLTPSGLCCFLLRLGFLGGIKRQQEIWSKVGLKQILILPWRISFNGQGTDSEGHCWCIFDKGSPGLTKIGWISRE